MGPTRMGSLHIIRRRNDRMAEAVVRSESSAEGKGDSVAVLLIQDAVLARPDLGVPVYVNGLDLKARGLSPEAAAGAAVDYDRICKMILEHDRTVVW